MNAHATESLCRHCRTPFVPDATQRDFCCSGCQFVHRLLHERGLEEFYRYGDAIALLEQIIGDPSTYTGAEINGLDYPARWGEIPVVYALGSDEYPKPFDSLAKRLRADRKKAERERLREQTKGMSPVFQTLYED